MPAIMDDPDAPTIYRVSGPPPYPDAAHPSLPPNVVPRQVTLRDRQTVATVVPFASRAEVPPSLLLYLSDQFRKEIEGGDTYPMVEPLPLEKFASYWFQNFGGIMLLGRIERAADVVEGGDWSAACLGSFYIKPNYPGRSSHVCNAGFLVTDAARNRGVGRLMGETYLDWAPKLGYTYSVFNLVYETNVASCRIWDGLGFKRIGRVKGGGNLKSHPGRLVDAIIYGRDLGGAGDADELVSDDRFDKIRFYLKYGEYPTGADRAEKSRLRSAATTYKLLDGDVLMLKDKEVVSNPDRQLAIARDIHLQQHAGINKTTATIAERYHWTRIKDTVSDVIRNCTHCKEPARGGTTPSAGVAAFAAPVDAMSLDDGLDHQQHHDQDQNENSQHIRHIHQHPNNQHINQNNEHINQHIHQHHDQPQQHNQTHQPPQPHPHSPTPLHPFAMTPDNYKGLRGPVSAMSIGQILRAPTESPIPPHAALPGHNPMLQDQPGGLRAVHHPAHHHALDAMLPLPSAHAGAAVYQQPIDPKIISQPSPAQQPHAPYHHPPHLGHQLDDHRHHASHAPPHAPPADPFAGFHDPHHHHHHPLPAHHATDAFTSLLNAPDDDDELVGSDGGAAGSLFLGSAGDGSSREAPGRPHGAAAASSAARGQHPLSGSGGGGDDSSSNHNDGADGVDTSHDDEAAAAAAAAAAEREAAVDRDLDMLIEPDDDDGDGDGDGTGDGANHTGYRHAPHAAGLALLPTHGAAPAGSSSSSTAGHGAAYLTHDLGGLDAADPEPVHDDAVDSIAGVVHVVRLGGGGGASRRAAMDGPPPPPPPQAKLDLAGGAASKMDIGRLLTTSAAAAASLSATAGGRDAAGAGDGAEGADDHGPRDRNGADGMNGIVVDGGPGRAGDDERLEDMSFGLG